jgi:hypothetical protein
MPAQVGSHISYELVGIGRSNKPGAGWPGKYRQKDVFHSDLWMIIREFMPDVLLHTADPASVSLSFAAPFDDDPEYSLASLMS